MQKIFKEQESIKIIKVHGSMTNIEYQKIYNHDWKKYKSRVLILSKISLIVPTKLNYQIFNVKVGEKYYKSYIIYNVIFRPQWLETDMAVVTYGQKKVLNRDNGNFVKTNAWKPLFRKMKTLHWNLTSFCIKWRFCVVLSSLWKRLQPVWPKYHVVNYITFVVFFADFDV